MPLLARRSLAGLTLAPRPADRHRHANPNRAAAARTDDPPDIASSTSSRKSAEYALPLPCRAVV